MKFNLAEKFIEIAEKINHKVKKYKIKIPEEEKNSLIWDAVIKDYTIKKNIISSKHIKPFKSKKIDNRFGDEVLFCLYKEKYENAVKNKRSNLYINTIIHRLKSLYQRMIPDLLKRKEDDLYYKFIDELNLHYKRRSIKSKYHPLVGEEPYPDKVIPLALKIEKEKKNKLFFTKKTKSPIDNWVSEYQIEYDLSEEYLRIENSNVELQKLTETFEKPAYEKAIEDFYGL